MYSQIGHYSQTKGLRLRTAAELKTCIAFVPSTKRLFYINAPTELVAQLCRQRISAAKLHTAFLDVVMPMLSHDAADQSFNAALRLLLEHGIIEFHSEAKAKLQHKKIKGTPS